MASKVFISFRFNDGENLKNQLVDIFDSGTEVINMSEDEDRSEMSDDTIRDYLYRKLKSTSITIVILSPNAINYKKAWDGKYDDWLYDELRYSLEDRSGNRTNGVIALYTDESEDRLRSQSTHTCNKCNTNKKSATVLQFDNLVRKNMMNIKSDHKHHKCDGLYDEDKDSYISLIHFDEFKDNYKKYIDSALEKRNRQEQFDLVKRM